MGYIDGYFSVIGNIALLQVTCPCCGNKSIVLGGETQCCGYKIDIETDKFKVVCPAIRKRRTVYYKERQEAIDRQNGKCIYCEYPFSTIMTRKKREKKIIVYLEIHMDHFVPYSYSYNNTKVNFVAACNVCNGIKSNKMFYSIEKAREYVQKKRDEKGYEPL